MANTASVSEQASSATEQKSLQRAEQLISYMEASLGADHIGITGKPFSFRHFWKESRFMQKTRLGETSLLHQPGTPEHYAKLGQDKRVWTGVFAEIIRAAELARQRGNPSDLRKDVRACLDIAITLGMNQTTQDPRLNEVRETIDNLAGIYGAGDIPPEQIGNHMWDSSTGRVLVKVTGNLSTGPDGREYVTIEGSQTPISTEELGPVEEVEPVEPVRGRSRLWKGVKHVVGSLLPRRRHQYVIVPEADKLARVRVAEPPETQQERFITREAALAWMEELSARGQLTFEEAKEVLEIIENRIANAADPDGRIRMAAFARISAYSDLVESRFEGFINKLALSMGIMQNDRADLIGVTKAYVDIDQNRRIHSPVEQVQGIKRLVNRFLTANEVNAKVALFYLKEINIYLNSLGQTYTLPIVPLQMPDLIAHSGDAKLVQQIRQTRQEFNIGSHGIPFKHGLEEIIREDVERLSKNPAIWEARPDGVLVAQLRERLGEDSPKLEEEMLKRVREYPNATRLKSWRDYFIANYGTEKLTEDLTEPPPDLSSPAKIEAFMAILSRTEANPEAFAKALQKIASIANDSDGRLRMRALVALNSVLVNSVKLGNRVDFEAMYSSHVRARIALARQLPYSQDVFQAMLDFYYRLGGSSSKGDSLRTTLEEAANNITQESSYSPAYKQAYGEEVQRYFRLSSEAQANFAALTTTIETIQAIRRSRIDAEKKAEDIDHYLQQMPAQILGQGILPDHSVVKLIGTEFGSLGLEALFEKIRIYIDSLPSATYPANIIHAWQQYLTEETGAGRMAQRELDTVAVKLEEVEQEDQIDFPLVPTPRI